MVVLISLCEPTGPSYEQKTGGMDCVCIHMYICTHVLSVIHGSRDIHDISNMAVEKLFNHKLV